VTTAEREALIQAVTSAWRPLGADGSVRPLPSWYDLDASARLEAFEAAVELRRLEAAADPNGLSTTARAVLARIVDSRTIT
jgi:hypothetical protein